VQLWASLESHEAADRKGCLRPEYVLTSSEESVVYSSLSHAGGNG
ncbi:jg15091, partial [Pararge aegeria aegeria]